MSLRATLDTRVNVREGFQPVGDNQQTCAENSRQYLEHLSKGLTGDHVTAERSWCALAKKRISGLTPTTPWAVKQMIVQDARIKANAANTTVQGDADSRVITHHGPVDTVWPRVRQVATAILMPLTLPWRVFRAAFRTVFWPISAAVAKYQGDTYGIGGKEMVTRDALRVLDEWKNLGLTVVSPFLPIVEGFVPGTIAKLREHYINRVDQVAREDAQFVEAKTHWKGRQDALAQAAAESRAAATRLDTAY
ncbi:MAG: hypothetical protein H7A36_00245 [Chlamydiales bacterium]|nr:hypothetical protein [Chlamydiales bacterium]